MKISIGSKLIEGPWGGGNLFIKNLTTFLLSKGHFVVEDLKDDDIDILLFTDPRSDKGSTSTFNHIDIKRYKKYMNPNAVVVQRINECDERKMTKGVNELYLKSSKVSNHIIFVSEWLRRLYIDLGISENNSSVILSGSDKEIFNRVGTTPYNKGSKIKIVTHHWSSNKMKGMDVYNYLDYLSTTPKWSNVFQFTYIGNTSFEFKLENSVVKAPMEDIEIAAELKKNHLYVTGSVNEPSGNHHIEAAQCGLPILFLNSGGLVEYCRDYGLGFDNLIDFEVKLEEIINNYSVYKNKLKKYQLNSQTMSEEYELLFFKLINETDKEVITNNFDRWIKKKFFLLIYSFKKIYYGFR